MKIKPNRPVHDPEFKAEHRLRFRLDSLRGPLNSRPYRNSAGYRVDGLTLKEKEITGCPYPFRFVTGRVGGVRTQWSVSGELLSLTNVAKLGVGVETRVSYSVDNGEGDLFFDPNGIESPEAGPTQSVEPRLRFNLANWKNNEETPVETRDRRLVKITEVKDPILSFPVVGDIPGSGAGCFWTAGGVYSLNPDGASPADLFFVAKVPKVEETQGPVETRERFSVYAWVARGKPPVETQSGHRVTIESTTSTAYEGFPVQGIVGGFTGFWRNSGWSLAQGPGSPLDLFFVAKAGETQGLVETREKFDLTKWINSGRPPVQTRDGKEVHLDGGQLHESNTYPVTGVIGKSYIVRYWTKAGDYDLQDPNSTNDLFFAPTQGSATFEKAVEAVGSLAKERKVAVKAVDPTNRRKFDILLWKSNEETPVVTKSGHEVSVTAVSTNLDPSECCAPVVGKYFSADKTDFRTGRWSPDGTYNVNGSGLGNPLPFPALDLYFRDIAND